MKAKILALLFITLLGIATGCNSDDDGNDNETATINGVWHLRNVSGGFAGVDIDYERGEVKWTFYTSGGNLVVDNNVDPSDPDYPYIGLGSGTYSFEMSNSEGNQVLIIEGVDYGDVTITASSFEVDDRPADGFLYKFER